MSTIDSSQLFHELGGELAQGFASIHTTPQRSPGGIPYLSTPGVVVLARPQIHLEGLTGFLSGFDPSLRFSHYLDDPTPLPDGAQLCKVAGQVCYMSFGPGHTPNAQTKRYFDNLKSSGHGSVLEHANFSLLFYGISRSVTHELIRHRAGFGFCLTGDTLIYSEHHDNGKRDGTKKHRLDDIYAMTQTLHGRSRLKLLRLRCWDEQAGMFTTGGIKHVVCSGIKPVFTVTLADGKKITATKEHRFLTKEGWMSLDDIVGGLSLSANDRATYTNHEAHIMVNGQLAYLNEEMKEAKGPEGSGHRLIAKAVKIVSIIYAGKQTTYDIEMDGENHNFVANGIITHNSQVSQRYVSGRMLRFVERPEYRTDETLHAQFLQRIERATNEYATLTNKLLEMQQAGVNILSAEARTDLRKKIQQAARSVLPNETEAPIVVTANARAWRHFIEMRASSHAETEIRELATRTFLCLRQCDNVLFDDYSLEQLSDGTFAVTTEYRKV